MLPNDILCRAAVYPSFMRDGSFDRELVMGLMHRDPKRKDFAQGHAMSLASLFLCRDPNGVHEYGAKLEELGNARKSHSTVGELPVDKASHYLGYYEAEHYAYKEIEVKLHSIRIYWHKENGLDEHFQFDLDYVGPEAVDKSSVKNEIRNVRRELMKIVRGPVLRPDNDEDSSEVKKFRAELIEAITK